MQDVSEGKKTKGVLKGVTFYTKTSKSFRLSTERVEF